MERYNYADVLSPEQSKDNRAFDSLTVSLFHYISHVSNFPSTCPCFF